MYEVMDKAGKAFENKIIFELSLRNYFIFLILCARFVIVTLA